MLRRIVGVLLIGFLLAQAVAARSEVQWRVTRTRHFILYYANRSDSVAARTSLSAEKWYADLSHKLGFSPGGVIPVYLYPDRASFSEATGVGRADTIVGMAQARSIKVDASGVFADADKILGHEMVHVFIARRLHGYTPRLPLWMNEGLAQYLTDDWSASDQTVLQDAVSSGAILPLENIALRFPADQQGRAIAYAESYSIVKYIAGRFSPASLRDILSEVKHGERFDTALEYSIGWKPDMLEQQWRQFIWEKYGMQRWFQLGTAVVSAVMAVFAIMAFRSRKRQKQRKTEEYEEEIAEAETRDYGDMGS